MQAVVRISGVQYLVSPGQELLINHLPGDPKTLSLTDVLLLINEDSIQVGQPILPGVNIAATVLGQIKGDKIRVSTFKAKSRYRKTRGFRPLYTKIKIEDINVSSPSPTSDKSSTTPKTPVRIKKSVKQSS